MTNKEQLAYLAGLIDGEGCVGIHKSKYRYKSQRPDRVYYRVSVAVVNTNRWVLEWCRLLFGGCVSFNHRKRVDKNRKESWSWRVQCYDAIAILEAVLSYLKIKQKQAKFVIEFKQYMGRKGNKWYVYSHEKEKKALYNKMKELNQRGLKSETT